MTQPRPITDEHRPQLAALWQNAYRFPPADAARYAAEVPLGETLGVVDEGRLVSFTRIVTFNIWAGEAMMPMGGIGGVATWADAQGKGHVGRIMRAALCVMRERGQAVSALYPFSHHFYRRYGWASCGRRMQYGPFTQRDAGAGNESGAVRAVTSVDEWEKIAEVYDNAAKRYFGTACRTESKWRKRFREVLEPGGQIYIAEFDGQAEGYMFCTFQWEAGRGNHGDIREFLFTSDRAARALFAFLGKLPKNVCDIVLEVPAEPDLTPYFIEPVKTDVRNIFMYRVVDLKPAIESRLYPPALEGSVCVSITDEHADWNAGDWELTFSKGKATAEKVDGREGIEFTINEFSDIYSGGCRPVLLNKLGRFRGGEESDWKILETAFGETPPALLDPF